MSQSTSRVQILGLEYEDMWALYKCLVNVQGKDLMWERERTAWLEILGDTIFKFDEVPRKQSSVSQRNSK